MLNFWFVGVVCLLMIALGIALQIALHISLTRNGMYTYYNPDATHMMVIGFPVPVKNVFSFVSVQFLTVIIALCL